MANTQVSGGARFYNAQNQPQDLTMCVAKSNYATDLFLGDWVKMGTDGGTTVGKRSYPTVEAAGQGGQLYGTIQGFYPVSEGTGSLSFNTLYGAASTTRMVQVRKVQTGDKFIMQDDGTLASGAGGALSATNIGLNVDLNVATAGSQTTGLSNMTLKGSTAATTATLQMKIVGKYESADNDVTSAYALWVVEPNNIVTSGGTGTTGV